MNCDGVRLPRGTIKRFREYMNAEHANATLHRHNRYQQRSRPYGDYLYSQDRDKFMVELDEWMANQPPAKGADE